jgi:transposase InsO family protein
MVRAVITAGLSKATVAGLYRTTPKTVAKWVGRFRAEGVEGLRDRSARPLSLPSQTPPATCTAIEASRRQRHTGKQIAAEVGVSPATVSRVLRRLGLNRIRDLEPAEPVRRYERAAPGEMIHIDIKKLGRFEQIGHRITGDRARQSSRRGNGWGAGWEFVHVCIDDHSRIAFSEIKPDEKADSAVPFLEAAVAYYKSLGIKVERVMTDNGSCYKSFAFRDACTDLGIKHIRTKPYTPKTNGKAERFIQTALREWAYAQAYPHIRPPRRRTPDLAAPIQLASAAWWHKISNTHQQTRSVRGQPVEAPQLERPRLVATFKTTLATGHAAHGLPRRSDDLQRYRRSPRRPMPTQAVRS